MGDFSTAKTTLEKSDHNELRYEGYIQHFGEIYFEVEEVGLDKESELNN